MATHVCSKVLEWMDLTSDQRNLKIRELAERDRRVSTFRKLHLQQVCEGRLSLTLLPSSPPNPPKTGYSTIQRYRRAFKFALGLE